MRYQDVLDAIFASYLRVAPRHQGRLDRDVRNPHILLAIIKELGLMPPPQKTIRVTGSKGKGTVSRFILGELRALFPEARVGLLVSPHELDHTDRMRINDRIPTPDEFVRLYDKVKAHLNHRAESFEEGDYFSPSGLFALLALVWFHEEKVDFWVLETGRGVIHDEVGLIPSEVSLVVSIFAEHLDKLGPSEEDIAHEKLAIMKNSKVSVLGPSAWTWYQQLQQSLSADAHSPVVTNPASKLISDPPAMPWWIQQNWQLAQTGVQALTGQTRPSPSSLESPSYVSLALDSQRLILECLISLESLDKDFYREQLATFQKPAVVFLCLPDDKDWQRLPNYFTEELGCTVILVSIEAQGLKFYQTRELVGQLTHHCPKEVESSLAQHLLQHLPHPTELCLFLGTHSFIRQLKISLGLALV